MEPDDDDHDQDQNFFQTTSLDILHNEQQQPGITTLCGKLDAAIGHGIATRVIHEFCGLPGSGKTQFCIQLCATVQIPRSIGGLGGKAVYIDTNQNFRPRRLQEIAAFISRRYKNRISNSSRANTEFSTNSILSRVEYFHCMHQRELVSVVQNLKESLLEDKDVKLIVIDSITAPFRVMDNYTRRIEILYRLLRNLHFIANEHNLAVVLTNDLTTTFNKTGRSHQCPSLGSSFIHKIGQRFLLSSLPNRDGDFSVYLKKTMFASPQHFYFKITEGGIQNID